MKTTNYRKIAMMLGGVLIATVAAGCYGGGGSGYSNNPYGYNSGYSNYGSSYPYRSGEYSHPQSYGNSYNAGYQNGVRADANRDHREDRVTDRHAVTVDRHSTVDRDKVSLKDSESANHTEKN
ncbi:hypothetical protein [Candidatus Binatus sp.]|uniref:hypothetical protein n=1 Tax=Candidatus Binatus sp. TaxID=2811406 RepID=UPI003BAFD2E9